MERESINSDEESQIRKWEMMQRQKEQKKKSVGYQEWKKEGKGRLAKEKNEMNRVTEGIRK